MNTTAAAVIVIIIAALILAVMAGITGYTLGRARAADDTKKASEADSRLNGDARLLQSQSLDSVRSARF